jgi:SAM-dependent methyltransferase
MIKTTKEKKTKKVDYFENIRGIPINIPTYSQTFKSRICLPILSLVSRDKALDLGLTPIDDERVIMALKYVKGRALDIGCGANNFIHSYGDGVGVDVFPWEGCDKVIKDAAKLPFKHGEFKTITYLACINHIPNRQESVNAAYKLLDKHGRVLVTMITPRWGKFIHWIRSRNDPDHKDRHIDHVHELLGMSPKQVRSILKKAGFQSIKRKRFVFGLNNIYIAEK